jgi:hypothetical protein
MTISMAHVGDTQTGQAGVIVIPSSAASVLVPPREYRPRRLPDSVEAAAILSIRPKTLQRMARSGKLR